MALVTVPLPTSEEPNLVQTTQLDGQTFVFEFRWNSREDRWSLDLYNEDGNEIFRGQMLTLGTNLLRSVPSTLSYVPPGILFLAGENDPTLDTIGNVNLIYDSVG